MGAYLSSPVTDKESGQGDNFSFASMQGWRTDHEDAHICDSQFLPGVSLFAVFDGHGGAEVACFAAQRFPDILKDAVNRLGHVNPTAEQLSAALVSAFEGVDEALRKPENFALVESLKSTKQISNTAQKPQALALLQASIASDLQELRDRGGTLSREEASAMMMKMMFARKLETQVNNQSTPSSTTPSPTCTPTLPTAGCTANALLITASHVICANAGDSRAVLSRKGGQVEALSEDHKPNDLHEKARIEAAGGWVETIEGSGGARTHYRVNGNLNLSRALGDLEYKKREDLPPKAQIITATPDVKVVERLEGDEFVLVACDGIWDVKDNQAAVDFFRAKGIRGKVDKEEKDCAILKKAVEDLLDDCLAIDAKESMGIGADNMTAILVLL